MDIVKKGSLVIVIALIALIAFSCKKSNSCYDPDREEKNKNVVCTQDCPGYIGCDGKFYCNKCIAAGQGIRTN